MRDRERERERGAERHRQREKQALCREPDVGLNPGTPGSHPWQKTDAQLLSPPRCAIFNLLKKYFMCFQHAMYCGIQEYSHPISLVSLESRIVHLE